MDVADDQRIAHLLIAIRRRSRLRQIDVARLAAVPRRDVLAIEAGRVGFVAVDRVRRAFEAAGGRARLAVWWNGAAADRLLDERHAALVEGAVRLMQRRGWLTDVEVSFSKFGERGSIDILAGQPSSRTVVVSEVKSELGSLEETNRALDVKVRLGPELAEARFGWPPATIGRLLILPDRDTLRRTISRHERTMASAYPQRGREVRTWLRHPVGSIRGIWFLSEVRSTNVVET
jgi:hypothetical protein